MSVIDTINNLQPGQYLQVTDNPIQPLKCVAKPEFICVFEQALEFAKVLQVVQKTFKESHENKVASAREKLSDRYMSFTQKHYSFTLLLTSLFLQFLGYKDANSLDAMATEMKLHYDQKTTIEFKNDEEIKIAVKKWPNLSNITLEKDVTNEGLKLISQQYSTLSSVEFDSCDKISSEGYQAFAKAHPTIKKIYLRNCKEESKIILQNCPQLTHLSFYGNQIKDDILKDVSEKCPHLISIKFFNCSEITYEAVKNFITEKTAITQGGVWGCSKMSEEESAVLKELIRIRASFKTT